MLWFSPISTGLKKKKLAEFTVYTYAYTRSKREFATYAIIIRLYTPPTSVFPNGLTFGLRPRADGPGLLSFSSNTILSVRVSERLRRTTCASGQVRLGQCPTAVGWDIVVRSSERVKIRRLITARREIRQPGYAANPSSVLVEYRLSTAVIVT